MSLKLTSGKLLREGQDLWINPLTSKRKTSQRLGTFEEWYAFEMKARDSKRTWHYPTELSWDQGKDGARVIYRTRKTDQVRNHRGFMLLTKWDIPKGSEIIENGFYPLSFMTVKGETA